jgi:hypothetical protein
MLIAHYMPWYSNKAISGKWGWHWTMNHFKPDLNDGGRQQAASHYRPLIGLYDSSDPDVQEYHALLMKFAGLDGAALDWYGIDDYYDYAFNNRNDQAYAKALQKAGLKFTVVYEDQTINQEVIGGLFPASEAVHRGAQTFAWLQRTLFPSPSFLKIDGHPVMMVFGPEYYKSDSDWATMLSGLHPSPAFFTLMFQHGPAVGAFSWPTPQRGEAKSWDELKMFDDRSKSWKEKIGVAYPRFNDIYKGAAQSGFPVIPDHDGATFKRTFDRALSSHPFAIQIATWNDWGEGTQIEPSVEFGFRDLELVQSYRKQLTPGFPYTAEDLRLPYKLFLLRKQKMGKAVAGSKLERIASELYRGETSKAKAELAALTR